MDAGEKLSLRQFHAFHLHTHTLEPFSALHHAGLLFQEWVVDTYACIEQAELRWLRENQVQLKMETQGNLQTAIEDGHPLSRVSVKTLLPSTHIGSPRYMHQSVIPRLHGHCPALRQTYTFHHHDIQSKMAQGTGHPTAWPAYQR